MHAEDNEWSDPVNDANNLYILDTGASSFGEIFRAAKDHFGPTTSLNEIKIEGMEWCNQLGCKCCGEDDATTSYILITRDGNTVDGTSAILLDELTID